MKKILVFLLLLISACGYSQQPAQRTGGKEYYTLSGQRHGASFFPAVRHKEVEYSAGDSLTFDRYHTVDVINEWMRRWAEKYPDIMDLYEAGRTYENRPVYQVTISAKKQGRDTDKPGAYFEGGRHSGEVTASESAFWMIKYLLENYGKNPEITRLIDTKVIYIRPVNNPDGNNLYLKTAQSNRSTVRPVDNDGDALLDEDPPDDIDGDGIILTMRWRDEKNGSYIPDPADSTGRILKRVPAGTGIYSTSQEGIDNDGDGRLNEDGIGGLDLHRNYPENWRPQSEETGRGFTQSGAGDYPLSEPETRSVVSFLLAHPNVYVVNSMDTSVPMHLRPPSTSPSEERMYPEDLKWYRYFDEAGKKITGYKRAGDVYNDYGGGSPLFGHGPDFGYWYLGAIWYGDEIWNGGRSMDYNNDGTVDQLEMLRWDDEQNEGRGFTEWKPAKHPVYGDVELGGFNPKFFSQNPPPKHLEKWIENEAMFNLEMVKALPELEWGNIEVKKVKSYKNDSADYQIKVSFRNRGMLPTSLKQAQLVKIVTPDRVVIELDTVPGANGSNTWRILESERSTTGTERNQNTEGFSRSRNTGRTAAQTFPSTEGGAVNTATFRIRTYRGIQVSGKASVYSTRGGVLKDKVFRIE